ncbi:hypothetical protein ACLESD_20015, partial [Pyxidicoccus sp. 3LFB2]
MSCGSMLMNASTSGVTFFASSAMRAASWPEGASGATFSGGAAAPRGRGVSQTWRPRAWAPAS